jgi:hypothetical protein
VRVQRHCRRSKGPGCAVFAKLDRAGAVLNALPNSTDELVAAINTRQVFDVFSRYLRTTLAEQPATPTDLATAVREQALTLEEAVIDYEEGYVKSDAEMRPVMAIPPSNLPEPPTWPPVGAPRRTRRWPTVAWLAAITLVAALGIIGWMRPLHEDKPPAAPTYTDQQIAKAKADVCTAFEKVQHAIDLANSHGGSSDYPTQLAAAALTHETLDAAAGICSRSWQRSQPLHLI